MFENLINEIVLKFKDKNPSLEDIIKELFENKELKEKFSNENRRSTIIGKLTNEILAKLNINNSCKIMAIGDIEYFSDIKIKWQNLVKKSLQDIDVEKFSMYDLSGQGSYDFQEKLFDYINLYYDFPELKEKIIPEIIPAYGSTDSITIVLDTLRQKYEKINFIYPEASFLASVKIAESYFIKTISIKKPSKTNFFISKNEVEEYFENASEGLNVFYFTAVGNPTGEKILGDDLYEIISEINKKDKNAIFILDNVYVGLLKEEVSKSIFKNIFEDKEIFEKIIFLESLSKTLGATGLRIGFSWTMNSFLSLEIKKNIILKKAGFSKVLNELTINLLSNLEEITDFQNEVYEFIGVQRKNFINYIKENFSEFFDFDMSSKVNDREGIYVLLKANERYTSQYIFAKTGIIGVEIILSDGKYIRYSFGNTNYF